MMGYWSVEENMVNCLEIVPSHLSVNATVYERYGSCPGHGPFGKDQWDHFSSGRVYPQIFSEKENGAEPCAMQTECLFEARCESPRLRITLGFLQPTLREIGAFEKIIKISPDNHGFRFQNFPQFEVAGKTFGAWMDAVERKVSIIVNDFAASGRISFAFPACESRVAVQNDNGGIAGVIFKRHEVLEGKIDIKIIRLRNGLFKVCARVVNLSFIGADEIEIPEKVLLRTFASTHFTLEADGGEFFSLPELPSELMAFADDCKNIGCWPIVAGDRKTALASPIAPEIVPQTTVEVVAGAEID